MADSFDVFMNMQFALLWLIRSQDSSGSNDGHCCDCVAAVINAGVVAVDSASFVQCPASAVAPPTCRHATLRFTAVRDSRTKSPPSTAAITGNASTGNAKPGISPWITDSRTRSVAVTWAGNPTTGISTQITSSGISATRHAWSGFPTRSGNVAGAGNFPGYDWSRSVYYIIYYIFILCYM